MPNEPMPLRDLPGYLESAKNSSEEEPDMGVVDMGRIVVKKKSRFPIMPIVMFVAIFIGGIGVMSYNMPAEQNITVVVDVVDPQAIPTMFQDSGGEVVSVEHKQDFTYEIKMTTYKTKNSLLEWLRNNRNVRSAKLKD